MQQQEATTEIPAARGTIFDRSGEPLAIGEQTTTVYADPRRVKSPRRVALAAAKALGVDAERLYPLLADRSRHFVYVKRKADPAQAAELERQDLAGLGFYAEELRSYPQRSVAAHVLGYAGLDNDGLEGLERSLDRTLRGRPGSQTTVIDPAGRVIDVVSTRPERPGADVFLTLDRRIQANAESVLRETVKKWGAKGGNAIVLDPRTGGVLAMAVAPSYDANAFGSASAARRRNRAVTDVYEPGSTFKVVTVAAALSEKIVTPTTPFTLPSSIRVADRIIHEHEPRPTRRMTVAQILSQSSNVGTITLAQMLARTRVESGSTASASASRPASTRPVSRRPPALLLVRLDDRQRADRPGDRRHADPDGDRIRGDRERRRDAQAVPRRAGRQALARSRQGRARDLEDRLRADDGDAPRRRLGRGRTGAAAAVPGYTVAGKTGTAAKPVPGGYSTTKYVASFVGVVPAKDPRLVVLVSIDEPRGAIWGGVVAAPAFAEIARSSLVELEVAPDSATGPTTSR